MPKYTDQKLLKDHHKQIHSYYLARHDLIKISSSILSHAKKSIFYIHAGDTKAALQERKKADTLLKKTKKMIKTCAWLEHEGSLSAALEEYVEAELFYEFIHKKKISKSKCPVSIDPRIYIAGLCDVVGELYRYSIHMATIKETHEVYRAIDAAKEIVGMLIDFHLTKYLRTKFDQAKSAHRKMEMVAYELELRSRD